MEEQYEYTLEELKKANIGLSIALVNANCSLAMVQQLLKEVYKKNADLIVENNRLQESQ